MVDTLVTNKIIILFSLLVSSIVTALVPLIIGRAKCISRRVSMAKVNIILDMIQGFGGGVLLGGGLLHLMPESGEQISQALKELTADQTIVTYPWAPLLSCTSLGLIFFVEIILTAIVRALYEKPLKQIKLEDVAEREELVHTHVEKYDGNDVQHENQDEEAHGHSHGDISFSDLNGKSKSAAIVTVIVLWISLSTHSFFEGLGLGAERSESSMWSIFAAIIAHKLVESFTMGNVINEGSRRLWLAIVFVVTYSFSTPCGIGIGILIAQQDVKPAYKLTQYCLLALASGAFLNVALFEVLFHQPKRALLKVIRFILYVFGFTVMAVLALRA